MDLLLSVLFFFFFLPVLGYETVWKEIVPECIHRLGFNGEDVWLRPWNASWNIF